MIDRELPILITGAGGMVGGATAELCRASGFRNVLSPSRAELDLQNKSSIDSFFEVHRPVYVLMIAAKVGGIAANVADPVGFVEENLQINLNLFSACWRFGTRKNLFLGSSCIYPSNQPDLIREEQLLTGPLESTNEGYALSKIVGLKLAKYYREQHGMVTVCPMLCNLYGTGDHFDLKRAHVLSSLVRRFVDARDEGAAFLNLWGTGVARREFLHSSDAARAILFFMDQVDTSDHINVGVGTDIAICELASLVAEESGYAGAIGWDATKPDGMMRKCLDVTRLRALGFEPKVGLREGIRRTIREYEKIKATGGSIE